MKKPMPPTKKSSPLSRAAYAKGGAVKSAKGATVNIVIAGGTGGPGGAGLVPAPMPVAARAPMPMPPAGLAGGAPPPPGVVPPGLPGKPPMKRGGRIMAGAGSGLGRLQKNHR